MTKHRLLLFLIISICFCVSCVSAFEDTFQYYPDETDLSDNWYVYTYEQVPASMWTYVNATGDSNETFSRSAEIYVKTQTGDPGGRDAYAAMLKNSPETSTYWAFTLRDYYRTYQWDNYIWLDVRFYNSGGDQLLDYEIYRGKGVIRPLELGRYEFSMSGSDIHMIVNGVDEGIIGGVSGTPAYIEIVAGIEGIVSNEQELFAYIDDVTTTGNIVGVGAEATSHTLTELNLDAMNISFGLQSFPVASYSASEYKIDIKRAEFGSYTDIQSEVVKGAGNTSPYQDFVNYNRSVDITENDTVYGLYMVYLTDDDVSIDTDYFFFGPPGETSAISFSSPTLPMGTLETITYTLDSPNFGTYNYHVRVYSTTDQIQSTQITDTSGTISWDTEDEDAGIYYAVISRTDKTGGAYSEIAYDIAVLSENIVIRGYVYDAQTETGLANVSINFSQGTTWYNTTSNATGYYELEEIVVNVELNVNASLVNYTHENFSFTPLAAQVYNVDLYLINNTPTYGNTTILGITYDYPMHQAVPNATVNIYNDTWSDTATSSSVTGFYLFDELTNGSYSVNATKTDYQDSADYAVDTNNGSFETQNILMYGIYDLTIRAQDATTLGYLSTFSVTYNDVVYTISNGSITFPNLTYGLYSISVSATGYYANSESILVDEDTIETIQLTPSDSVYYTPHYVKFTIQNIWGTKYSGVSVSVYEGSDTSTTYTGTTGSDGSVTFKLSETTQYRITFINATAGISETRTLYPADNHYYIIVSSTLGSWDTYTVPISDSIVFSITKSEINSSTSYINISYNDSLAETTDLIVYLNQSNESDYINQTNLDTWAAGANSSGNYSFIVSPYLGESFFVHLVAQHTTYGVIDSTYSVSFKDDISSKFPAIPPSVWLYSSVFMLLFMGGIFVHNNVERGMLLVCILFFMLYGLGAFSSLPDSIENNMLAGGIVGFIISVIANLNKSNRDEGFQ